MKETLRQIVHLIFGLLIAWMILSFDRYFSITVLAIAIFGGLVISDAVLRGYFIPFFSPILDLLERRDAVPGKGALFFTISALFCLIIFDAGVVFRAILVLSLLDSLSTIYGMRYGSIRIYNGKSLEGSLVGAFASLAVLIPFLPLMTACIVSAIAGIVELISPVDDNLTIPLTVCLLLTVVF